MMDAETKGLQDDTSPKKKLYLMQNNTSHTKGRKTDNTASLKDKWHIAPEDTNIKQLVY